MSTLKSRILERKKEVVKSVKLFKSKKQLVSSWNKGWNKDGH